jgi:hypothetical protein
MGHEQGFVGRNEALLKILTLRPRPGKAVDAEGERLVMLLTAHTETLIETIDALRPLREENEHLQRVCIRAMIDEDIAATERDALRRSIAGTPSSEVLKRVDSRLKEAKAKLVGPVDRLRKTTELIRREMIEAHNETRSQLAQQHAFIQLAQEHADRRR